LVSLQSIAVFVRPLSYLLRQRTEIGMNLRTDEFLVRALADGAELEILFVNNYAQIFLLSSIFIFNKYMHALNLYILLNIKIFLSPDHPPRDITCPVILTLHFASSRMTVIRWNCSSTSTCTRAIPQGRPAEHNF